MWNTETLQAINQADDLKIAPYRANGKPGTPTWIWEVAVDGRLFVRAYSGTHSSLPRKICQQPLYGTYDWQCCPCCNR